MSEELHLPDLNYACVRCGRSCSSNMTVQVDPMLVESIALSKAAEQAAERGYAPLRVLEQGHALVNDPQGRCALLTSDNLCSLHAELGPESKPSPCRDFPFFVAETPDGYYLGASFLCHAIQNRCGPPLKEQVVQAEEVLRSHLAGWAWPSGQASVQLLDDRRMEWSVYLAWEERLRANPIWDFGKEALALLEVPEDAETLLYLQGMVGMVTASAVSLLEAKGLPESTTEIAVALAEGRPFYSARLGREVPAFPARRVFEDEVRFYLEHVLFRKFLIRGELIGRLLFLQCKSDMLAYFSWQRAILRGASEPSLDDYQQALVLIEQDVLHRRGQHPMVGLLSEGVRLIASQ